MTGFDDHHFFFAPDGNAMMLLGLVAGATIGNFWLCSSASRLNGIFEMLTGQSFLRAWEAAPCGLSMAPLPQAESERVIGFCSREECPARLPGRGKSVIDPSE
jgi:hypothetical protein